MISLKMIRAITRDRRSQMIGDAIGRTNHVAGIKYLEGASKRIDIENKARATSSIRLPGPEDSYIVKVWSDYYKSKARRKAA